MKKHVLVACEESQRLTVRLRALGINAYSCDILKTSGDHPEWHINQDVLPLLNGFCKFTTQDGTKRKINKRWDAIIAFPPCTYTTNAGAKHLYRNHILNVERYYKGLCGKALLLSILAANCDLIAVENHVPSKIYEFPKYTQMIQPYYFGEETSKKTLLWIKGFPLLEHTNVVVPKVNCHQSNTWFSKGGKDRQINRSKLLPGIADAMANQWGNFILQN